MWLMNRRGMLFGNRLNLIDALVLIFLLGLIPMIYYGIKLANKPIVQPPPTTQYKMSYTCPICKKSISVQIDYGKELEKNHEVECGYCKNRVLVNKPKPQIMPPIDWIQEHHRYMLEEKTKNKTLKQD